MTNDSKDTVMALAGLREWATMWHLLHQTLSMALFFPFLSQNAMKLKNIQAIKGVLLTDRELDEMINYGAIFDTSIHLFCLFCHTV